MLKAKAGDTEDICASCCVGAKKSHAQLPISVNDAICEPVNSIHCPCRSRAKAGTLDEDMISTPVEQYDHTSFTMTFRYINELSCVKTVTLQNRLVHRQVDGISNYCCLS